MLKDVTLVALLLVRGLTAWLKLSSPGNNTRTNSRPHTTISDALFTEVALDLQPNQTLEKAGNFTQYNPKEH